MTAEMEVDGKKVPMNAFTQEIIGNVAAAMAGSLRGVDGDWKEIVIRVRRED